MANTGSSRPRGTIRQRGKSFQVAVYAGLDPVTGRRLYLRETTASRPEAERALRRLASQVDEDRHTKTQATFRVAMESWLRTHEIDESTKSLYRHYGRVHLYPAFGDTPIGRISTRALEEFYADLRRCSKRCDGKPSIEHRIDGSHECREIKHKRPPPVARRLPVIRPTTAPPRVVASSSVSRTSVVRSQQGRSVGFISSFEGR